MITKIFRSRFLLLMLFNSFFTCASHTFAATTTNSNNEEIIIQDNQPLTKSASQLDGQPDKVAITLNGSFFNLTQQKQLSDIQQSETSPVEFHTTMWRYIKRYNQLLMTTQSYNQVAKLANGVKTSPLNTKNAQVAFSLPKFDKSYLVINYQAQSLVLNNVILVLPLSPDKSTLAPQQLEIYRTISQATIMALSRGMTKESADIITKELWNNDVLYQRFNGKHRWLNTNCDYNATLQNRICIFYKKN